MTRTSLFDDTGAHIDTARARALAMRRQAIADFWADAAAALLRGAGLVVRTVRRAVAAAADRRALRPLLRGR